MGNVVLQGMWTVIGSGIEALAAFTAFTEVGGAGRVGKRVGLKGVDHITFSV